MQAPTKADAQPPVSSGGSSVPKRSGGFRKRGRLQEFFQCLGPGLITGAADDDPSGISTYSVTGAKFGYGPLWTALFSFPLMASVQLMSARLGMVTGKGFACMIRHRYPRWILWGACALLLIANIANVGADLGGMAEVTQMVTGIDALVWTPVYTVIIVSLLFWSSYKGIARVFKWLTLVLFAYVVTAFLAKPDWHAVFMATFVPHVTWSRDFISILVGVLGTTISPYLLFWQAAQEVEEVKCDTAGAQPKVRKKFMKRKLAGLQMDVVTGMLLSNLVMYFIILTTAATLHAHGKMEIGTAKEAAEALRPLAGAGAYWLFALGLIGTGMLGVPVLAGSSAYAVAEAAGWERTLDRPPRRAPQFYAVIGVAMVLGMALNYAHLNAVKMLFWSAVLNGLLVAPLILLLVLLTSDRKVMGAQVNSPVLRSLGWLTFAIMAIASVLLFVV